MKKTTIRNIALIACVFVACISLLGWLLSRWSEGHLLAAMLYHDSGKYKSSLYEYSKEIELAPGVIQGYTGRIDVYRHLKMHSAMIDDCLLEIQKYPNNAEFHSMLGWAYCKTGKTNEGLREAEKALRLNARNTDAYETLGLAHYQLGDLEQAVESLDKAIALDPPDPESYAVRSMVFDKLGDHEKAQKDMETAKRLHYIDG